MCLLSLASPQDKAPAVKGQDEAAEDPEQELNYLQQDDSPDNMEFEDFFGSDNADLSELDHDAPSADGGDDVDDNDAQQLDDANEQRHFKGLTKLRTF